MGLTYFKRYRMELDLTGGDFPLAGAAGSSGSANLPGYRFSSWREDLLDAHADAKYRSFCIEIDANVFACLGEVEGCRRLMREIARRQGFLSEATWLLEFESQIGVWEPCGTVQGVRDASGYGAIQNLGITPEHRGRGLGTALLFHALQGFREAGLGKTYLEVTAQNVGAVRLYQRLGFRCVKTVYKASDVAYA